MAEALYRKYRPQVFEDVVGQEHIERTLKNAIDQDQVSHAYLFTGPRGTGKTTTARLLAKALLCEEGPTSNPDGTCEDCVLIANGTHPDVYELDAASRTGVENVREEIIGRVQFAPTRGRYKIYIIDEVHMLSTAAFNALLKTLEEPPDHVVFILATTDPQKVPETIHSRCQRFDFHRISPEAIVSRLGAICINENVEFEGEALDLIAHKAEGGMRNALTSLEQLIAFGEGKVTLEAAERLLGSIATNDLAEIVRFVGQRDVAACFRWTADYLETGADLAQFTRDFAEHVRNLYVMSLTDPDVELEISESERRELAEELPLFGSDRLARLLGVLGDLSAELKTSTNPRLSFEIALTRMVRPESDLTLAALAERIEALEQGQRTTVPDDTQVAATSAFAAASAETPATSPIATTPVASAPPTVPAVSVPPTVPAASAPTTVAGETSAANSGLSEHLSSQLSNPASLQRMWQNALTQLKKEKQAYGVLFLNTRVDFDNTNKRLVIKFSPDNNFAYKAVQKPDVQQSVAAAIASAFGEAVPFIYTQSGESASAASPTAPAGATSSTASASAASPTGPTGNIGAATISDTMPAPTAPSAPDASAAGHAENKPAAQEDMPTYDDEPVPYDDEVVPYGDEAVICEPVAYEDTATASEGTPAQEDTTVSSEDTTTRENTPALSENTSTPSEDTSTSDDAAINEPEDLQALLAAGFGDGVIVEEVRE